jgi:hypothetical protein
MKMKKVVLDSKSHQGIRHLGTEAVYYGAAAPSAGSWKGRRLTGFQSALASRGYALEISDLSPDRLTGEAILVVAGRMQQVPFSIAEIASIAAFCNHGGSLLLMANHMGHVTPQNQLAEALRLPVRFHETTVAPEKQQLNFRTEHPISKDCNSGLKIRTSCTMTLEKCPSATVLAEYEDRDFGPFAVALEHEGRPRRRTVAMTSAGHISSDDDTHADLWAADANATWTLNIIDWLAYRL